MLQRYLSTAIVLSVLGTASLTSCSTSAPSLECEPAFEPGVLSESFSVSSTSSSAEFSIETELEILNTQRSTHGEPEPEARIVNDGDIVAANIAYIDASNGEVVQASPTFASGNADSFFIAQPESNEIVSSTLCAQEGETIAVGLTPAQSTALGIAGAGAVVAIEVVDVFAPQAEGKTKNLPSGFPAIAVTNDGRPGVVLPPSSAPKQITSATHILGTGAPVQAKDQVIAQVLEVSWDGFEERNSWNTGPLNVGTEADAAQTSATFRASLTGVPVGSQVVILEPIGDSARVTVVDILAVA